MPNRDTALARMAPALLLAITAPMFAEVLPGATRFSSMFVFPIEMAVWGGGAVLARDFTRRSRRGWWALLLLGLTLAIAEELLIQQTSAAPLVLRLKGETWARAFGINYVYLIWALVYESLWVVLLPTLFVELIFPDRRQDSWLSKSGAVLTSILFLIGCGFAWFTWTQIARVKVFHQAPYTPPLTLVLIAAVAIAGLVFASTRLKPSEPAATQVAIPSAAIVGGLGALWAAAWFCLVVLAFGIAPRVPPLAVVVVALLIVAALLLVVPRWASSERWGPRYDFAVIAGSLCGSMAVSFFAFQGAATADLWFKIIADCGAVAALVWLGRRVLRRN